MKKVIELTDEVLRNAGFSEEEIDVLVEASALASASELLPDNPDKVFDRIEKEIPNDLTKGMEKFADIAKNDTDFFATLFALQQILECVEEEPEAKTEKVTLADIKRSQTDEIVDGLLAKMRG